MSDALQKKDIGVIICYMGTLPWYFEYFKSSCKFNPSIDFYIITDDTQYNKELPENVYIVYDTLEKINERASEKLGFKTRITKAYKLCDFKPAYGYIFSDIITQYEFWAHADLDVIFGDIENFFPYSLRKDCDLLSCRHDYLTGYFLLFRNCEKMNTLFMKSKDYRKVLGSEKHYCFDETNFFHIKFTLKKSYRDIKSEIESMTHVVKRLEETNDIRTYFEFHVIEGNPGKLMWNHGHLTFKNKYEVLLYHLIVFKNMFTPPEDENFYKSDIYEISDSQILHH